MISSNITPPILLSWNMLTLMQKRQIAAIIRFLVLQYPRTTLIIHNHLNFQHALVNREAERLKKNEIKISFFRAC